MSKAARKVMLVFLYTYYDMRCCARGVVINYRWLFSRWILWKSPEWPCMWSVYYNTVIMACVCGTSIHCIYSVCMSFFTPRRVSVSISSRQTLVSPRTRLINYYYYYFTIFSPGPRERRVLFNDPRPSSITQ